jgi:hypothetical protein
MHETDGYKIMFRLAVLGQHPMLVDYPALPRQPRQTDSQTLPDYVADWMHFLHIRSLDGMYYSDRYFLQQFCENMHRNFGSFVRALNEKIAPFNSPGSINYRAPPLLNPEAMLLTLQQHAMQKHKPELMNLSPRDLVKRHTTATHGNHSGNAIIQALKSLSSPSNETPDDIPDGPLSDDEAHRWRVFALSSNQRSCFWCGDDHRLPACPKARKCFDDPRARQMIRKFLAYDKPPPPKKVSQVIENSKPDESIIDSENSSVDSTKSSDFP